MRKIKTNKALKKIVKDFGDNLFMDRSQSFIHPLTGLKKLSNTKRKAIRYAPLTNPAIKRYLDKIITDYKRIITADFNEMKILITEFDAIIPAASIPTLFHEDIVKAMRYTELRERDFLKVLQLINVKNCIYCHSQSTVIVNKETYKRSNKKLKQVKGEVSRRIGLLQLDHRHSKSKYPFLAISFYNLYPTCASCNVAKSDKDSDFDLYTDGNELDVFRFKLDNQSVLDFIHSGRDEDLKIDIESIGGESASTKAFLDMFNVRELYDTHKDIAAELVHKKLVYTNSLNKQLIGSFKKLFPDQAMINRLLIGNYDQPEDVFKRPMAKFVQDIARDIDLIP